MQQDVDQVIPGRTFPPQLVLHSKRADGERAVVANTASNMAPVTAPPQCRPIHSVNTWIVDDDGNIVVGKSIAQRVEIDRHRQTDEQDNSAPW
jgi:hypothetical protein